MSIPDPPPESTLESALLPVTTSGGVCYTLRETSAITLFAGGISMPSVGRPLPPKDAWATKIDHSCGLMDTVTAAHDMGRAIDLRLVEGRIEGGLWRAE